MTFSIKADTRAVEGALQAYPAAYARESIPALEEIADGIIASIRGRMLWPRETKGILKQGLWRGEVRSRKSGAEIDTGWSGVGAAFGPGHEWGFKKAQWMVRPVGTRKSTAHSSKRLGRPIRALRFVVGGKVVYSRGHMVSKPKKEVKHFRPAYDGYPVSARIALAAERAKERVGL